MLEVGNVEQRGRRLGDALEGLGHQAAADRDVLQPAEESLHLLDLGGLHSRLLGALGRHDQAHAGSDTGARCSRASLSLLLCTVRPALVPYLFLVAVCRCKELPKLTYPPPSTSSQRKPAPVARRLSDLSTRMREFEAWRRERSFAPPPRAPQKEKRAQLPPVASAEVSLEEKERQDYAEVSLTIGEKEEEDREIREPPPPPPGDAGPSPLGHACVGKALGAGDASARVRLLAG